MTGTGETTCDGVWCRLLENSTQVWWRDRPVELGGRQNRRVLAGLLLHPGAVVSVARLVGLVWGDDPPRTAGKSLQVLISHLRRVLPGDACRIVTVPGGYLLDVDAARVDLHRFRHLVDRARQADDPRERAGLLSEAVDLVSGEPLADLAGTGPGDRVRDAFGAEYLAAVEESFGARLDAGRSGELVPGLTELVAAHPLREGPPALLMRALRSAGRPAEALAVYAGVRAVLADQLGTEPGPVLRRLHAELLAETEPGGTQPPVVPRQLPAAVDCFTGRSDQLAALTRLSEHPGSRTSVVVAAIGGTAGVGKTALAVYWAHLVADRYPDGQLYVNLRGFGPSDRHTTPTDAVRGFLDALHVPPERVPAGLDAQAALYRSLTAGKRMLVVLDNAHDERQVRPLLPGPGCLALVTSRNRLAGLVATHGAHLVGLDLLAAPEAYDLLSRRLGPQRVHAEPGPAAELVELCARLPLALAITAARAAAHPGHPLAALAADLRDAQHRLDSLDVGEVATSAHAVFSWSYRELAPAAARMFRHLGLHPGPDISVPAATSLAGLDRGEARRALTELTRASLITEHRSGRYTMHDLLRAYATRLAHTHDGDDQRRSALRRVLDHYVHAARVADGWLNPQRDPITVPAPAPGVAATELAGPEEAMAWLTAEHPVLLASIELGSRNGFDAQVHCLAWLLATFLDRKGRWSDEVTSQHRALDAARRLGDRIAEGRAHRTLSHAYGRLHRYDDAYAHVRRALDISVELGDDTAQANAHIRVAWLHHDKGRYAETIEAAERALRLFRKCGDRSGEADTLNVIGWCHALLGRHRRALAYCRDAVARHRTIGNARGEAAALDSLGYSHHHLGDHRQAIAHYQRALALIGRLGGSHHDEVETLIHLGDAYQALGDHGAACEVWQRAIDLLTELDLSDHPQAERLRAELDRHHRGGPTASQG